MQVVPVRRIVAVVMLLLAGVFLQVQGVIGEVAPVGAGERSAAATTVEGAHDAALAPSVTGRTGASTSMWSWVTARAVAMLLGFVALLVAAVWLALRARSGTSWFLARPERARATTRRRSPLAARRAPPAPAAS